MTDWNLSRPDRVTLFDWLKCCFSFPYFKKLMLERTAISGQRSWYQGFKWGERRGRRHAARRFQNLANEIENEPLGLINDGH